MSGRPGCGGRTGAGGGFGGVFGFFRSRMIAATESGMFDMWLCTLWPCVRKNAIRSLLGMLSSLARRKILTATGFSLVLISKSPAAIKAARPDHRAPLCPTPPCGVK